MRRLVMGKNNQAANFAPDDISEQEQRELRKRILDLQSALCEGFVAKDHIAQLVVVSAIAGEPLLLVGAPGAGKSAIVKRFARLLDVPNWACLDYVITRHTEPAELYTPPAPDAPAGQTGHAALMNAQVVFLDEVFQASSGILNPLLRRLSPWELPGGTTDSSGHSRFSLVVATTRNLDKPIPNESLLDRFTLQAHCDTVNKDRFSDVIRVGIRSEVAATQDISTESVDRCSVFDFVAANHCVRTRLAAETQGADRDRGREE